MTPDHPQGNFNVLRPPLTKAAARWGEAADRYREAADTVGYPLRYLALADAARCLLRGGDSGAAAALAQRIEQEAPDLRLPPHLESKLREITSGS